MENTPSISNLSEGAQSYNTDYSNARSDDDVGLLRAKYKQSNNKVYHDFFKTKMCSLYSLNICKKGNECPFAHSEDELRDKPNLYKTKICEEFLVGECPRGENCQFAHGEYDLRSTPDLFKTAMCNLWTQGKCTAGESCRFAHGFDDLRPAPSHHKFKKKKSIKGGMHKNMNGNPHGGKNNGFNPNIYYANQFPYAGNMYGYPMYSMPLIPGDMNSPYMMGQPYGYDGGMDQSIRNH